MKYWIPLLLALFTVSPAVAQELVRSSESFSQTPLILGQNAREEGMITDGRFFGLGEVNGGRASAVWLIEEGLQDGSVYEVVCNIRILSTETDALASGKVSTRLGNGPDLERIGEQRYRILATKNLTEEREFRSYFVYDTRLPYFGVIAFDLKPDQRVEVSNVRIIERDTPWAILPKKNEKTFLVDDVLVEPNSLRPTPIPIPPGATEAHVKLTYAPAEILTTAAVEAYVSPRGSQGFNPKKDITPPDDLLVWRDGDDRDHWVTFQIKKPSSTPGDRFRGAVKGTGVGGWVAFDFEVVEGAVNELPETLPYHRLPYELVLPDSPTQDLDMARVEWDESGYKDGKPVWTTHPAYVYTQPGNSETGIYLPYTKNGAQELGQNPHSLEVDAEGRPYVLLHTRKLDTPAKVAKGKTFPHQASMLQGQNLDEWCHRRGVYSAQLVLPDRRGAWSAFWACGRHYPAKHPMWPPEIDFLESFNGAYGAPYHPDTTSAGQHAGLHGSVNRSHIDGFEFDVIDLGFSPELNFNTQIHDYTTVIEDDWITHFRDGIEFFRQRNILDSADGEDRWDFYPILNVAVKDSSGGDYSDGSGDMRWYGLQYYAPDSGYELKPYQAEKPYPNREIPPRPQM